MFYESDRSKLNQMFDKLSQDLNKLSCDVNDLTLDSTGSSRLTQQIDVSHIICQSFTSFGFRLSKSFQRGSNSVAGGEAIMSLGASCIPHQNSLVTLRVTNHDLGFFSHLSPILVDRLGLP